MVKIAIVEDEKVVAWHIQVALEKLGHRVVANVASGKKAIQAVEETQPQLVLMDIRLRGKMSGIDAAEVIYQRFNIPVIYLTAYTDAATMQQAMRSSPFGYLAKPLRTQDLQTTIEVTLHRHQTEQALRRSQQWFATTLTSLGDGAIATDASGIITFINPVAEQLTGWSCQEAIGQPISRVLDLVQATTRAAVPNPLLQALQQDAVVRLSGETLLRSRAGTERPISDSAAPIKTASGEIVGAVLVFQDESDRQLAQLYQELEWLNQLKEDFLSAISHELRTPLTNMRLAIEMLRRIVGVLNQVGEDAEAEQNRPLLWQRMQQYLQILQEEWQREFDLIADLLDYQDSARSTQPLPREPVELQRWLPQLLDRVIPAAAQQRLVCQVSSALPPLMVHLPSLERIMAELLSYACKCTPPGQPIQVVVEVESNFLKLMVVNTGIEMPASELAAVFQPFRQIAPLNSSSSSTGLGLALAKKLVARLEGKIYAESSAATTRFVVLLPLSLESRTSLRAES